MNKRKLLKKIFQGSKNVNFGEFIVLIESFGFRQSRQSGSHHIFVHSNAKELINIQNVSGKAKPYQVRQFLKLVEKHNLELGGD